MQAQIDKTREENPGAIPVAKKPGAGGITGLPDKLKTGIENRSGYSMDDVKVHYNSNDQTF